MFLLPIFLMNLSVNTGSVQTVSPVFSDVQANTVRIIHSGKFTTHYGTTGEDVVMGSGVLLENGQILTCYHVLDGYNAGTIKIMRAYNGKVEIREGEEISLVAYSGISDLLLLQVTPPFDGPFCKLAEYKPDIGEEISFAGYTILPVTKLRLYRYLEGSLGIMLTPVFFGDSGGGVFNSNGELIGIIKISLALRDPFPQYTLYGYACPLDVLQQFMKTKPKDTTAQLLIIWRY
jgi:S1-C subfamily serine protease